ncbi:MAG: hypothetical protein U5K51_01595 [Flavobacteriaceae bacterium]|nr:hypothetical protein [Flavobacteriaceae bacterium]
MLQPEFSDPEAPKGWEVVKDNTVSGFGSLLQGYQAAAVMAGKLFPASGVSFILYPLFFVPFILSPAARLLFIPIKPGRVGGLIRKK